jgi:predicted lipid-binding transport protein (Tim44 family)
VKGAQAGEEFELAGPAVIGRSSSTAALVIRDSEASRKHASVIPEGDSLNVEDLGSTNGTFVNEERIDGKRTLLPGDQLRVGTTVLELAPAAPPADVEPVAAPDAPLAAEPEPVAAEDDGVPAEAGPTDPAATGPAEDGALAEATPPPVEAAEPPPATWASQAAEAKETAKLLHRRLDESFSAVLRAWSNRDVEKMRPYVTEAHLGRAWQAADALDRDYQVNYIKELNLRDVAVSRPAPGAAAEPTPVYVSFVARDWIEDLRTGEVIDGDPETLQAIIERWTFVNEGRRGWVIDRVESVWSAPAEQGGAESWPGLPAGWYSLRNRPATWREWTGAEWEAAPAPTS